MWPVLGLALPLHELSGEVFAVLVEFVKFFKTRVKVPLLNILDQLHDKNCAVHHQELVDLVLEHSNVDVRDTLTVRSLEGEEGDEHRKVEEHRVRRYLQHRKDIQVLHPYN